MLVHASVWSHAKPTTATATATTATTATATATATATTATTATIAADRQQPAAASRMMSSKLLDCHHG